MKATMRTEALLRTEQPGNFKLVCDPGLRKVVIGFTSVCQDDSILPLCGDLSQPACTGAPFLRHCRPFHARVQH